MVILSLVIFPRQKCINLLIRMCTRKPGRSSREIWNKYTWNAFFLVLGSNSLPRTCQADTCASELNPSPGMPLSNNNFTIYTSLQFICKIPDIKPKVTKISSKIFYQESRRYSFRTINAKKHHLFFQKHPVLPSQSSLLLPLNLKKNSKIIMR